MTICEAACWSNAESPTLRDVNKHPASIQNTLHSRNSLIYRASHTSLFTLKMVVYTRTIIYAHYNKYFHATSSGAAFAPPWVSHAPWRTVRIRCELFFFVCVNVLNIEGASQSQWSCLARFLTRQIQTRKIRKNGGCYTLCGLCGLNLYSTLIRKFVKRTVVKRSITVFSNTYM